MIRIVVYATDYIGDVSALDVQRVLHVNLGTDSNAGVRVSAISQKQYDKGMKRHRPSTMDL